ncbi:MAG: hypothetical protein K6D59_09665 [Bacteroidales bacterium]|nr:hypothetical protein [Bacteroidales bacterium]
MKLENGQKQKWTETYRASIISVLMMLFLLVAAVMCHLFGWKDAPFQFLAACLGAGVTVIITNLLLVEQTNQQSELQDRQMRAEENLQNQAKENELKKIKETEQYKTQLRIYQEYLESLYSIVSDRQLTTEEKIKMQFQTAYLAMHTESFRVEKISESLKDIIDCLISPSGKNYNVKQLQQSLLNIVSQFREELYPEAGIANYDIIVRNFTTAFMPEGKDEDGQMSLNKDSVWQQAVKRWTEKDKWKMSVNGETICLHRPGNTEIHVQFGFWEEHYYIEAKYHKFSDFSQELKWKYKGRKTYETWWKHIDDITFNDLKEGEFWNKFKDNEIMQNTLVKWFDTLVDFIEKFDVPVKRFEKLTELVDINNYRNKGWRFWIFDAKTVVCDSNYKDEGEPFIDTYTDGDKIVVVLYNRADDLEKQKQILGRIGLSTDNYRFEDGRTIYAEFDASASDDVVMAKTTELMAKLAK